MYYRRNTTTFAAFGGWWRPQGTKKSKCWIYCYYYYWAALASSASPSVLWTSSCSTTTTTVPTTGFIATRQHRTITTTTTQTQTTVPKRRPIGGGSLLVAAAAATTSPLSPTLSLRQMSTSLLPNNDVELYHEMVASAVDLSNAHVSSDGILTVTRSTRDIDNNKRRRFLYTMLLPTSPASVAADTPSSTLTSSSSLKAALHLLPPSEYHDNIKLRLPSPSGKKTAIFRLEGGDASNNNNKQSNILEIWNGASLEQRIVLSTSSPDNARHGKVIIDPTGFGQPNWSANEECLIYAAERNPIKSKSYFAAASPSSEAGDKPNTLTTGAGDDHHQQPKKEANNVPVGGSFTLGIGKLEGWGEKYTKQAPLFDLYLVHTGTGRVARIENVPPGRNNDASFDDGVTLGQAVLSPSLSHVVYTAWHVMPAGNFNDDDDSGDVDTDHDDETMGTPGGVVRMSRRFGMIYCQQRPCQLYASPIQQLVQQLSTTPFPTSSSTEEKTKDGNYIPLTPRYRIALSPRFGPRTVKDDDTTYYFPMVFLSSSKGFDTHSGCLALSALEWNHDGPILDTLRVVVDQVIHPKDSPNDQVVANLKFPGLFLLQLPESCFVRESDDQQPFVLTTTLWGSVQRVVRISLASGKVELLPIQLCRRRRHSQDGPDSESFASQTLLAITNSGGAVVTESEPHQPASLAFLTPSQVCRNTSNNNDDLANSVDSTPFAPILASTLFSSKLPSVHRGPWGLQYEVINLTPPPIPDIADSAADDTNPANNTYPLQCILMRPPHLETNNGNHGKVPLVVVVHGGPHSCFSTLFTPTLAFLCASGYALLIVNYRGSTGFGQASIDVLPGRCGSLDVEDVVYATNTIVEQYASSSSSSWIDKDRLGICGGSHGGFLTGHIIGQYPQLFQAAVMRNPVTNIATMVSATDIPDWCHVEALGKTNNSYDWTKFASPTQDELAIMYAMSPAAHVQNVVTPTLVALGLSDQRVPPSQGLEWYYTLRSNGVPTKLLVYEDNDHGIDGVESEADHWMNIKRWLDKYLMKKK